MASSPRATSDVRSSEIVEELEMTVDDFVKVCDRFTNKRLFLCDGRWSADDRHDLTKTNYDNLLTGS